MLLLCSSSSNLVRGLLKNRSFRKNLADRNNNLRRELLLRNYRNS